MRSGHLFSLMVNVIIPNVDIIVLLHAKGIGCYLYV